MMSDEWRTNVRAALVQGTGSSHPEPVVLVPYGEVDDPRELLWEAVAYPVLVTDQTDVQDRDQAVQEWLEDYRAVQATSVYRLDDIIDLGPWESAEQAVALAEAYRARKAARRQAAKKGAATRKQKEQEVQRQQRQQEYEASMSREQEALAKNPRIVKALDALTRHLGDPRSGSCGNCGHPGSFHTNAGLCKAIGCHSGPNGSVCRGFVIPANRIYRIAPFVDKDEAVGLQVFTTDTETSNKIADVLLAGFEALSREASA